MSGTLHDERIKIIQRVVDESYRQQSINQLVAVSGLSDRRIEEMVHEFVVNKAWSFPETVGYLYKQFATGESISE